VYNAEEFMQEFQEKDFQETEILMRAASSLQNVKFTTERNDAFQFLFYGYNYAVK